MIIVQIYEIQYIDYNSPQEKKEHERKLLEINISHYLLFSSDIYQNNNNNDINYIHFSIKMALFAHSRAENIKKIKKEIALPAAFLFYFFHNIF